MLAGLEVLVSPVGTVPVGVIVLMVRSATRVPAGWPRVMVAVVVGVIGFALSVNVGLPWDEEHYAFFLFPMRDVAAGKSLLVDVNAQYGIGLIYALTWLTGPSVQGITPTALSAWTNVANVVLYLALLAGCAWLVRDWALGSLSWLAVIVNRFVSVGSAAEAYRPTGAWRFGLPWLLVADAAASRGRMAPWRRVLRMTYWMVASTWSLEVALYSMVILTGDLTIDAVRILRDGTGTERWRRVSDRLAEAVLGAVTGVTILVGVTRWRSGEWPDTRHYFQYFGTYGAGLGFEQPAVSSAWSPMLLGCAAVMTVLAVRSGFASSREEEASRDKVVALVGAYGVLQFTYYIFRPHTNNWLHVMFPSAVLAVWLLGRTTQWSGFSGAVQGMRGSQVVVSAAVVSGMALVGASGLTALVPRLPTTLVGQASRLWDEGTSLSGPWFESALPALTDDQAALRDLLARRYRGSSRVPMLLSNDLWIHGVIGTPYVNAIQLSFAAQDAIVPVSATMVVTVLREMPFGSEVVIEPRWLWSAKMEGEMDELEGLRLALVSTMCERGSLIPLESAGRVVVVRFADGRDGHDLCERWGTASFR